MGQPIDRRGKLGENPFSYRATKDGKVFILWHGKCVTTISGAKARNFLDEMNDTDETGAQLVMAKVTGHFKHGNER